MVNLVFMGKQGSGKGTQAKIVSEKLGICHISTGDLLRGATGKLKEKIDFLINQGILVGDELILEVLQKRIKKEDCKDGFILDGYPRNLEQAKVLEKNFEIDKIVEIFISDREVVERLVNRLNCKICGALFNKITNPPIIEGVCDKCGGRLFVRDDDNEETIKKRLRIYKKDTEPILEFFKDNVLRVDGSRSIDEVNEEILEGLNFSF